MKLLVIGAAGRTGRLVVGRALGHGHDVTATVHDRGLEGEDPRVTVARGDALDFDFVDRAVAGNAAVVVAIGGGNGRLHEPVIANVVHAMARNGVERLAVLSAAGTFAKHDPNMSIALRMMVSTVLRSTYEDLEAMERRVMASDLAWTIVRPVGLVDGPPSGDYRVSLDGSLLPKASRIARADVAAVLLKAVESDTYWRKAVVVGE